MWILAKKQRINLHVFNLTDSFAEIEIAAHKS
jgi:hypothetical protein